MTRTHTFAVTGPIGAIHKLQPHRIRNFKRSRDPEFTAKLADIVGLYLAPPQHAAVLSVGEKNQIQALDRARPGLLLKPGKAGTMTHDDICHGTTTLFPALNVLDGTVPSRCMQRHCHQKFIRFLNVVEAAVPPGNLVYYILDNCATHKPPKVRTWLDRHERWTFRYTPTSGCWLNEVETFSAMTRRLRRGTFRSLIELQAAIRRYLAEHNADPKPVRRPNHHARKHPGQAESAKYASALASSGISCMQYDSRE